METRLISFALIGAMLLSATHDLCAQAKPASEDLNSLLEAARSKHRLPGLAAMVVKGTNIIAAGAVGVRKFGSPEPLTIGDKFHIGSNTKAMTATLAAMLVEQGKLSWTTRLAEVFPELAKDMNPAYREVTLEQLLSHRSGAPANINVAQSGTIQAQRLQYLKTITSRPPEHKAGTDYHYSNAGYIMAGAMIERVMGKDWEELIRERLFTPLQMKSVGFGPAATPNRADQPWGHQRQGSAFRALNSDNPKYLGPAGTVHCTLEDYARFCALHLQKSKLQASSFTKLQTPVGGGNYAMGWISLKRPWAGGVALTHAGSNTMNYFCVWLAPQKEYAIIVATNLGGDNVAEQVDSVIGDLIGRYLK